MQHPLHTGQPSPTVSEIPRIQAGDNDRRHVDLAHDERLLSLGRAHGGERDLPTRVAVNVQNLFSPPPTPKKAQQFALSTHGTLAIYLVWLSHERSPSG
jgi:hypothetical protein